MTAVLDMKAISVIENVLQKTFGDHHKKRNILTYEGVISIDIYTIVGAAMLYRITYLIHIALFS